MSVKHTKRIDELTIEIQSMQGHVEQVALQCLAVFAKKVWVALHSPLLERFNKYVCLCTYCIHVVHLIQQGLISRSMVCQLWQLVFAFAPHRQCL